MFTYNTLQIYVKLWLLYANFSKMKRARFKIHYYEEFKKALHYETKHREQNAKIIGASTKGGEIEITLDIQEGMPVNFLFDLGFRYGAYTKRNGK